MRFTERLDRRQQRLQCRLQFRAQSLGFLRIHVAHVAAAQPAAVGLGQSARRVHQRRARSHQSGSCPDHGQIRLRSRTAMPHRREQLRIDARQPGKSLRIRRSSFLRLSSIKRTLRAWPRSPHVLTRLTFGSPTASASRSAARSGCAASHQILPSSLSRSFSGGRRSPCPPEKAEPLADVATRRRTSTRLSRLQRKAGILSQPIKGFLFCYLAGTNRTIATLRCKIVVDRLMVRDVFAPCGISAEAPYAGGHCMANPHSLKSFYSLASKTICDVDSQAPLGDGRWSRLWSHDFILSSFHDIE